ncbi:MAG: efflux RND transporter periplasmic adaptor subunit [Bacteroidales bacterium]
MKNLIQTIKQNAALITGTLVVGLFLGWLFFHGGNKTTENKAGIEAAGHEGHNHETAAEIWTCSMHPQIKMDKAGKCPICSMDLIPLSSMESSGDEVNPNAIVMTESAAALANIQTVIVRKGTPEKPVFLQGKIQADERNIAELTARFGGRIEKLFVNYTGQEVRKGEKLATLYSPGLVTAQRELIEAISFKESRPALYKAARAKLRLWDLTDEQIDAIEKEGEPQVYFDILSPITGTVTMRHVALGDYVKEGSALFQVIDLTTVWGMFDAYESDLPWMKLGDEVEFTVQALPGKNFKAKITYIDPFIDAKTRIAKVRVDIPNRNGELKPEMFLNGTVRSKKAATGDYILVPKSAILWTGKRAVVYVKLPESENPAFLYREVTLGPEAGAFYVITDGLSEGEEIAVNGVFKIDAAAQLQGLPSMMNPEGGVVSTGHNHGGMDRSGGSEMRNDAASEHAMMKVAGNCGMCKDRIETAVKSVKGVKSAEWESETKMLHLNFNPSETNIDAIQKAIAAVGHDTEKYKAKDEVYENLPGCCLYERLEYKQEKKTKAEHAMIKVAGNCGMCKDRIETAAKSVKGVESAEWDSETKVLHLNFNPSKTNVDAVQKAIAAVGHDTEKYKAPDEVYEKLPGCCLYRENK